MKQEKEIEEISKIEAQNIVLGHINELFDKIEKPFLTNNCCNERIKGNERYKTYKEIASTILDRDLPTTESNNLVNKILEFEWKWKSRNIMRNFLEENGLELLAKKTHLLNYDEVFEKTLMLFPQSEEILKESFNPILDHHKEIGNFLYFNVPWAINHLLLVKALNFTPSEKQIIAKSWLAGFFFLGEKMLGSIDSYYSHEESEVKQERDQSILLVMKEFGVEHCQILETAQNTIKQFSQKGEYFSIFNVESFFRNIGLFAKNKELNWNSFTKQTLLNIYNTTRTVSRNYLWDEQKSEKERLEKNELRLNLVFWLAEPWLDDVGSKKIGYDRFKSELNDLSESVFFQKLDYYILDNAKKLGQKIGLDEKKVNNLMGKTKSSDEFTQSLIDKKEKEIAEYRKEIKKQKVLSAKKLTSALKILEIPGIRPE